MIRVFLFSSGNLNSWTPLGNRRVCCLPAQLDGLARQQFRVRAQRRAVPDEPVRQPDDEPSPQPDDGATVYDLIIDVRSPEEFAEGHRKGAVNVPLAEFLADPVAFVTDRDASVLFVCQKGIKSRIAAEAAIRHGFWKVCYAGEQ